MKCRECHKKISRYARKCPYCQTEIMQTGKEVKKYLEEVSDSEKRVRQQEERKKKKQVPIHFTKSTYKAVACMMIAVLIVGATCIRKKNKWDLTRHNVTYITDNGIVSYDLKHKKSNNISKTEKIEPDTLYGTIEAMKKAYHEAPQKKCIYYMDHENYPGATMFTYGLYKKSVNSINSKPECISKYVSQVAYDKKDNVYYAEGNEACLYQYDGKETKSLSFCCIARISYDQELDQLLVQDIEDKGSYGSSEDRVQTVYEVELDGFTKQELFKMDTEDYYMSKKDHCIYFLLNGELNCYNYDTKEIKVIAKQVKDMTLECGEEKDYLYYNTYTKEEKTCYDFVLDEFYNKDKNGSDQNESVQKRNRLREEMKSLSFDQLHTALYCYQDEESKQIGANVAEVYSVCVFKENVVHIPSIRFQEEIKKRFELKEDGTGTGLDVSSYYLNRKGEECEQDVRAVKCYENVKDEAGNSSNQEYEAYLAVNNDDEELILYHGELIKRCEQPDKYMGVLVSKLNRTKEGTTCEYDIENECLKISNQTKKAETIIEDVFAYRILDDGRVLCHVATDKNERKLWIVEKSGEKKLLAKNVWRLLGEDTCSIKDAYFLQFD